LAVAVTILVVQGPGSLTRVEVAVALAIAVGLALLRLLTVRKRLAPSTLALDAVGTVIFLTGTGAPISPFYLMALAGAWWAAHIPRRRSGLIYGGTFAAAYLVLAMPQSLRAHLLAEALEDTAVVIIVAVLADWFVRVDKRALQLNEALSAAPFGTEGLAIRERLQRALGIMDIPVDVVLAAAQIGLTVTQAELLAYLVLGLTNREIAEATSVSEATVRYRLTRLYRALGVHRRHEAVRKALAMGLALPIEPAPKPKTRR
jgi:DNA-binding CsgD family transcriptional regulator